MTLEQRLIAFAQAVGADIKALTLALGSAGAQINDGSGNGDTAVTWSADKIFDAIEAAKVAVKNDLTGGAAAALDTLAELATALGNDPAFATNIATAVANRVRYDAAQVLTAPQQAQACSNLGVGDPGHDFVGDYNAAKV